MNFLGMGLSEMAVIFLVAFLALGPSKSIDMARTAGKALGDLRRTFNEVISATTLDAEDRNGSGNASTRSNSSRSNPRTRDSSGDSSNTGSDAGRQ